MHRDVKAENVLLSQDWRGKLCDFGMARGADENSQCKTLCGTPEYMAPEVLTGAYSTEVDLWSLGVIVFFMLSGYLPFPGRSDEEKEERILRGQYSMGGKSWTNVSCLLYTSPSPRDS